MVKAVKASQENSTLSENVVNVSQENSVSASEEKAVVEIVKERFSSILNWVKVETENLDPESALVILGDVERAHDEFTRQFIALKVSVEATAKEVRQAKQDILRYHKTRPSLAAAIATEFGLRYQDVVAEFEAKNTSHKGAPTRAPVRATAKAALNGREGRLYELLRQVWRRLGADPRYKVNESGFAWQKWLLDQGIDLATAGEVTFTSPAGEQYTIRLLG